MEELLESCPMDKLCSELGGSEQLLVELREKFEDWLKLQPHLPKDIPTYLLNHFIIHTKFSLEIAKQKLDMYYTVRRLVPEFFSDRDPQGHIIQRFHENMQLVYLPKLTPKNYRVFIMRPLQKSHENFYFSDFLKYFFMVDDIRFSMCNSVGAVYVCDYANITMGHFTRFPPTLIKKADVIARKAYALPIRGIHFINVSPFMMSLVNMFKSVLSPKLSARIHVHSLGSDSLTEFVPRSILPKDYGGDEISMYELNIFQIESRGDLKRFILDQSSWSEFVPRSILPEDYGGDEISMYELNIFQIESRGDLKRFILDQSSWSEFVPRSILPEDYGGDEISMYELNNLWRKEVLRWKNWFLEQENVLVDESRRPGPMVNDDDLFGFSGTFRKLEVD